MNSRISYLLLQNGRFVSVHCDAGNYAPAFDPYPDTTRLHLGFVCEARPVSTAVAPSAVSGAAGPNQVCVFPFSHYGTHDACATMDPPPGWTVDLPNRASWCATAISKVTQEPLAWGVCQVLLQRCFPLPELAKILIEDKSPFLFQDERTIIYGGGAQGETCMLPFYMSGQ